jgi:15-cis-phytoene synthase
VLNNAATVDRGVFSKLHEALAAADMDLARMTYSNLRELRAYCSRSGGAIQELMAAHLMAPQALDDANRATAHRLGIGVRQGEILRDVRQDAFGGRVYLPQDHLNGHNVTLDDLRAREAVPRLKEALRAFRDTVRTELQPSTGASPQLRPLLVLAALHRRLLDRIAARDFEIAAERIELGPLEKPWVAWRAARKSG